MYAATALLEAQARECHDHLLALDWYSHLDVMRQSACLDIAFNNGITGLLQFPRMIAALTRGDWVAAATECKVTNPELEARYAALAKIILTGAQ